MMHLTLVAFHFSLREVFSCQEISFVLNQLLGVLPVDVTLHEVFSSRAFSFILNEVLRTRATSFDFT